MVALGIKLFFSLVAAFLVGQLVRYAGMDPWWEPATFVSFLLFVFGVVWHDLHRGAPK